MLAAAQNIMSGRKGGEYVLALAKMMPKTRFLIVGAEEDVLCPPNVSFVLGKQSAEEMANLYRGADVFLITSREDNFPTVCLEAAACGTPVAGFLSGGAPETVSPGISRFVPFGDVAALKSAVKELFCWTIKNKMRRCLHMLQRKCTNATKGNICRSKKILVAKIRHL